MNNGSESSLDLERLLKLRLVVARFGEMDLAKWWNTKGQLGKLGAVALRRGFPRTHHFAQARSVLAVAAYRCRELFDPPGSVTLWWLPESIEEEFDARWEQWLDDAATWAPFFERLAAIHGDDLLSTLADFELIGPRHVARFESLRRSAEGRAVPLLEAFAGSNDDITLLALGFARGDAGAPAVPYARRAES